MATQLFALARTAGRMRHQVLALSGAAVAAACYTMPDEQYMPRLPSMVPVAYADVNSTTATATPKKVSIESKTTPNASIALSGFEDVKVRWRGRPFASRWQPLPCPLTCHRPAPSGG